MCVCVCVWCHNNPLPFSVISACGKDGRAGGATVFIKMQQFLSLEVVGGKGAHRSQVLLLRRSCSWSRSRCRILQNVFCPPFWDNLTSSLKLNAPLPFVRFCFLHWERRKSSCTGRGVNNTTTFLDLVNSEQMTGTQVLIFLDCGRFQGLVVVEILGKASPHNSINPTFTPHFKFVNPALLNNAKTNYTHLG